MYGAWLGVRAGRGVTRGLYRTIKRQQQADKEYHKTHKGGKWSPAAVVFMFAPFTFMAGILDLVNSNGGMGALWLAVTYGLVMITGIIGRWGTPSYSRVPAQRAAPERSQAARWKQHADLLDKLHDLDEPDVSPDTSPEPPVETSSELVIDQAELARVLADLLTERLLSSTCPVCTATPALTCAMWTGIPVALVKRKPVQFCHKARAEESVRLGFVTAEEVNERIGGKWLA